VGLILQTSDREGKFQVQDLVIEEPVFHPAPGRSLGDFSLINAHIYTYTPSSLRLNRMLRKPTISSSPLRTEATMPHEYFCHSCKKAFSKPTTSDYEEGDVVCPHCGSGDVEPRTSAFYPISSKETA
jgi:DNA-directed RNA polymerase subunit RPC12/RpoP